MKQRLSAIQPSNDSNTNITVADLSRSRGGHNLLQQEICTSDLVSLRFLCLLLRQFAQASIYYSSFYIIATNLGCLGSFIIIIIIIIDINVCYYH
jgi:hypothetical protein